MITIYILWHVAVVNTFALKIISNNKPAEIFRRIQLWDTLFKKLYKNIFINFFKLHMIY